MEKFDIMFQMVVASMEAEGHQRRRLLAIPIMIVYKNSMPLKVEAAASVLVV